MAKQIWVSPYGRDWKVQSPGLGRAIKITETQAEARQLGIEIAKNQKAEFILQGKDGLIREKNSYGTDKFPPQG